MKITYEINRYDSEGALNDFELNAYHYAQDNAILISEIRAWIRTAIKYKEFDSVDLALEELRDMIIEDLTERGLE